MRECYLFKGRSGNRRGRRGTGRVTALCGLNDSPITVFCTCHWQKSRGRVARGTVWLVIPCSSITKGLLMRTHRMVVHPCAIDSSIEVGVLVHVPKPWLVWLNLWHVNRADEWMPYAERVKTASPNKPVWFWRADSNWPCQGTASIHHLLPCEHWRHHTVPICWN